MADRRTGYRSAVTYTTRRRTPAAAAPPSASDSGTDDAAESDEAAESGTAARPTWGARLSAWWGTPASFDVAAWLAYVAYAFWLTAGLWPTPSTRAIGANPEDQTLI